MTHTAARPAPGAPRRTRSVGVLIRVTPAERDAIKDLAARVGATVSELIRRALLG